MRFPFRVNFSSFNVYTGKPLLEWLCQLHTFLHCKHCFSNIRHTRFRNFKDIEGRLMGVVIFLRMGKKCIIKQLTSVQPPFCNIVTYSVLTEQLRKFVPQERLFTCYTWLISSSRSRPITWYDLFHLLKIINFQCCLNSQALPFQTFKS